MAPLQKRVEQNADDLIKNFLNKHITLISLGQGVGSSEAVFYLFEHEENTIIRFWRTG